MKSDPSSSLDEHLHALHEILEAAGNVGTLEDYLAECLSIIVSTSWLSPFPSAALFLSDKGSESLRLTAHHNFDPELLTLCANVPFGSCLCGQAASGNTILFSSDIDHRHQIRYEGIVAHGHYNVPIRHQGVVLGVLVVYLKPGATKDDGHVQFLDTVGSVLGLVISLQRSAEDARAASRKLDVVISRDQLTGVYSREFFLDRLAEECSKSNRTEQGVGVAMADIDHFKVVNDRYGHAAGDRVLAEVSALMQVCCRDYDFSGRYGGEEFVFCLAGAKDRTDFIAVAERMRQQVERHPITLEDGTELRVTVSIGLALYDGVEKGVELVGRADRAMYQAKTAGRNRVQVDIPAKG